MKNKIILFLSKLKKNRHYHKSEKYIDDLRKRGATIGKGCVIYSPKNVLIDLTSLDFIKIGDYVQLTDGVKILAHDYSYSVVANKFNTILRPQSETVIGNNVFIGMNSIILMGSNIGNNVIIGAGSVVKGNIDSDSVYAGNPARKICSIDEYYRKLEQNYENSARCYYKCKCKNNVENKMNIYISLFTNEVKMSNYVKNLNLNGISQSSIDNMKFQQKYNNFDEFKKNI